MKVFLLIKGSPQPIFTFFKPSGNAWSIISFNKAKGGLFRRFILFYVHGRNPAVQTV